MWLELLLLVVLRLLVLVLLLALSLSLSFHYLLQGFSFTQEPSALAFFFVGPSWRPALSFFVGPCPEPSPPLCLFP